MIEATGAAAEPQPQPHAPTHEDAVAIVRKNQEKDFDRREHTQRLTILIRKSDCGHAGNNPLFGAYNPSLEYSLAELRTLTHIENRLNYSFEPTKPGGTGGVLAENKYGLYSVPKAPTTARKKPHMNHRQQAIKSAAIRIFRKLVEERGTSLRATCKEQEIEYLGLPDAMIPKLGEQATRIAIREITAQRKAYSRNNRRRQEHSRKVNAGLLSVATSETNYVNRRGQFAGNH